MIRRSVTTLLVLTSLVPAFAVAEDGTQAARKDMREDVLEQVVVRNRLYQVKGKLEVSPTFGLMPVTWLTEHYNLNVGAAYNLLETLAVEARGGYALTRHTGTARRVAENFLARDPTSGAQQQVDDFSNLWEIKANLVAGLRWSPLYGKISLLAERPVHFQAYLWGGGGAATMERESIVYCLDVDRTEGATCNQWLNEKRTSWLGSAAVGFRFFTHQGGALRIEVRDYLYPDRYRVGINRVDAESGNADSGTDGDRGVAHLVMFDVGYTFFF